jgi:hypothetical protein
MDGGYAGMDSCQSGSCFAAFVRSCSYVNATTPTNWWSNASSNDVNIIILKLKDINYGNKK